MNGFLDLNIQLYEYGKRKHCKVLITHNFLSDHKFKLLISQMNNAWWREIIKVICLVGVFCGSVRMRSKQMNMSIRRNSRHWHSRYLFTSPWNWHALNLSMFVFRVSQAANQKCYQSTVGKYYNVWDSRKMDKLCLECDGKLLQLDSVQWRTLRLNTFKAHFIYVFTWLLDKRVDSRYQFAEIRAKHMPVEDYPIEVDINLHCDALHVERVHWNWKW